MISSFVYCLRLHISLPLNLMAITLRPLEIIDLGKKETSLIRLVQLGWLLENHLSCFLGYTYIWLFQSHKATDCWTQSQFKWQFIAERVSFRKIPFPFIFLNIWRHQEAAKAYQYCEFFQTVSYRLIRQSFYSQILYLTLFIRNLFELFTRAHIPLCTKSKIFKFLITFLKQ